jgi:hypothetical protein
VLLLAFALGAAACGGSGVAADRATTHHHSGAPTRTSRSRQKARATPSPRSTSATTGTTSTTSTTTTSPSAPPATTAPPTTAPAPAAQHGPITEPPLPPPGPGFVPDQVTAVGDSVMIDYEGALQQDIPGVHVTAAVSRWWTTGESILEQLKGENALGAVVIVGLGTNGPITSAQFDSMMSVLSGASRVVFVNVRVDRTWQDANNAVLASGVSRYPRAQLVDWYSLAIRNPGWLYSTQTHLPIDGPGADALAALVAGAA